jgi:hypothetical protein
MSDRFTYKAFGLNIESELKLPELIVSEGPANVSIVFGKVAEHLEKPTVQTPWYEIKSGEYLLTVNSIARYYAENGRRIVIEPLNGSDDDDIRVFLLDSVFAALLQQRGFLALHGSTAVINGKAVVMLGKSSVGKTAVALALYGRGFALLADEICAVSLIGGGAVIHPGAPWLHTWQDTLETAGKDINGLRPIRRLLVKYSFPVQDRFAAEPVGLSQIFILNGHNREDMMTEAVTGGNKLEVLLTHAFFTEAVTDRTEHFKVCAAASTTRMIRISYNCIPGTADKVAGLIMREAGI